MRLPFLGIIDKVLDSLKRESYLEVRGGNALTPASYTYVMTEKGNNRAPANKERAAWLAARPIIRDLVERI